MRNSTVMGSSVGRLILVSALSQVCEVFHGNLVLCFKNILVYLHNEECEGLRKNGSGILDEWVDLLIVDKPDLHREFPK